MVSRPINTIWQLLEAVSSINCPYHVSALLYPTGYGIDE
jgi:hypothetical protein